MRQQLTVGLLLLCGILLAAPIYTLAGDCPGGWSRLSNYKKGSGGACRQMGLDSKRGTCQPGQMYETLCDDSSGGKYKICQGPRRCSGGGSSYSQAAPPQNTDCTRWDYKHNRPCPNGYVNNDCIGTCESLPSPPQQQNNNCQNWDYKRNQPCPPGYVNSDCRGGCE